MGGKDSKIILIGPLLHRVLRHYSPGTNPSCWTVHKLKKSHQNAREFHPRLRQFFLCELYCEVNFLSGDGQVNVQAHFRG